MPRVTMHDVARKAGVSQPLVSQVIGGSSSVRVSEATRERILRAAEELGYRPNVIARALVQSRSYSLGIIIPDLYNPFFADVVAGVERVASDEGYAVLLANAGEVPAERHIEAFRARQIDGVIIDAVGAASLDQAAFSDLTVVLIDEPSDTQLSVMSDAPAAGRLAAEHLLALGHVRTGLVGPATDLWAFRMRERGFMQALRAAGLRMASNHLRRVSPTVEGGRSGMRALLAERDRPTAVFCTNDLMALGAIKACIEAGVGVPRDMSVCGCDDIDTARLVTPELTTIHVRAREMGARAARLLIRQVEGEGANDDGKPERERSSRVLGVHLVTRGSTAPPSGGGR
ncbi:MAG TPA: LacI family DNA-binding transcriptional regulator [Gemmatimonadaceae bacterium]|jgi:LacI family transcriptional regulator, galactose operon repressor|nr:LacI family DNA-binding transcriptional regulator [Gemmatimonadaceae bacterium]